jgi:hypothetical protein
MKTILGPFPPRRAFLRSLSAALPALALLPRTARAVAVEAKPPSIRALTRGPRFHWRGYYDKLLFDPGQRFVLANEVDFEGRSPRPDDVLHVGMIDLQDGDRWIELGTSRAWNWQQGCMLQWVPGTESSVAWNDREGDRFICHVLDVRSGVKRTLPHPFYCLSPDGRWGLAPDFRRLNDTRPGYGYPGIPDPNRDVSAPADAGIWRLDMRTGEQTMIFSFADAVRIPQAGGFPDGAKHWFNHLLFNTDGKRFVFLHRWRQPGQKMWLTRMFSLDPDGRNPFLLIPTGKVSHFVWRDATHVTAYAGHPPTNDWKFCVFEDQTDKVEVIGDGVLNRGGDGHNTYVPGTRHQWVLNDTYPDARRCQNPHLFHIPSGRVEPLGHFHTPPEYQGEWRCDTHPCASPDGKKVLIDSPHGGNGRQVYLIDISGITAP